MVWMSRSGASREGSLSSLGVVGHAVAQGGDEAAEQAVGEPAQGAFVGQAAGPQAVVEGAAVGIR